MSDAVVPLMACPTEARMQGVVGLLACGLPVLTSVGVGWITAFRPCPAVLTLVDLVGQVEQLPVPDRRVFEVQNIFALPVDKPTSRAHYTHINNVTTGANK